MSTITEGTMSGRTKLVELVPRPDGVDQPAFLERWRRHYERALASPSWASCARSELCAAVSPADDPALPAALFGAGGLSDAHAGVGLGWFDDAVAAPAESFGGDRHATREEVVFDKGGTEVKLFSFLHRRRGLSLPEFSAHWRTFADTFLAAEELTRHCSSYIQNHVVDPEGEARFHGIAEMGFRDVADVVAFVSEPTLADELIPAEGHFINRTDVVVVVTRPTVLLERELTVSSGRPAA